jgi:hypothetical protein
MTIDKRGGTTVFRNRTGEFAAYLQARVGDASPSP